MPTKAVFLDRDGTLLELIPYLQDPALTRLVSGAGEALRRLAENGYARVVVTNQSGVARGWFTMSEVDAIHERMRSLLRADGADIEAVEVCPHHPEFSEPCLCRKPLPGLIIAAAERLGLDLSRSWVVGDRIEDAQAGRAAGCRTILVLSGYGREESRKHPPAAYKDVDFIAWDLPAAIARILAQS
jgi:D-glycero-D-manno-heptose 1,7-bisphosphate phosphatase